MSPPVARRAAVAGAPGFTLVELLVAITIVGIIAGAITATYTVLAHGSQQTQARLEQSRGPKFSSVYWTPDVASSETVDPAGVRCGTVGTPVVTFQWSDDRLLQQQIATWATVTGQGTDLVRTLCDAGSLATPKRSTVIAPHVVASGVDVLCDAGAGLAASASPSTPARVVLDVTTLDGRSFTVDANRQVS